MILDGQPRPRRLYAHQEEALIASYRRNEHVALTSGTGSGKTEAFLLPIFARLAQEASGWPAMPSDAEGGPWWRSTDNRTAQRAAPGHRPAAVRALVLFPMNALVEDQLVRLRKYLDSPAAREWLRHLGGNRFYFGRYTGRTPVAGRRDEKQYKKAQLRRDLQAAEADWRNIEAMLQNDELHDKLDQDTPYVVPRIDESGSGRNAQPVGHATRFRYLNNQLFNVEHHAGSRRGSRDLVENSPMASAGGERIHARSGRTPLVSRDTRHRSGLLDP